MSIWLILDDHAFRWAEGEAVLVFRADQAELERKTWEPIIGRLELPSASLFEFVAAASAYMEQNPRPPLRLVQSGVDGTTERSRE